MWRDLLAIAEVTLFAKVHQPRSPLIKAQSQLPLRDSSQTSRNGEASAAMGAMIVRDCDQKRAKGVTTISRRRRFFRIVSRGFLRIRNFVVRDCDKRARLTLSGARSVRAAATSPEPERMANERCTEMHGFARFWPFDRLRAGRRRARHVSECSSVSSADVRKRAGICRNVPERAIACERAKRTHLRSTVLTLGGNVARCC